VIMDPCLATVAASGCFWLLLAASVGSSARVGSGDELERHGDLPPVYLIRFVA
jgi:hypothetical protein